jgi:adenylosuccinate lyase
VMNRIQVFPKHMQKNLELTKGLVFSQRVMLALIDKGLARQKAYEIVQRNAAKTWEENKSFLAFIKADKEVTGILSPEELANIFNYKFYLLHVDEVFLRLGLTKSQWQGSISNTTEL